MKEDKIFTEDVSKVTFDDCIKYADSVGIDFVYIEKNPVTTRPCPVCTYKGLVYQVRNRGLVDKVNDLLTKGKYRKAIKMFSKKVDIDGLNFQYLSGYYDKILEVIP